MGFGISSSRLTSDHGDTKGTFPRSPPGYLRKGTGRALRGPPARYACNPPSDGVTGGFSESASQDCNLSLPKANQSDDPLTETPPQLSGGPNQVLSLKQIPRTRLPSVGQ